VTALGDAFYGLARLWGLKVGQPVDTADYVLRQLPSGRLMLSTPVPDLYVVISEEGKISREADVATLNDAGERVVELDRSKIQELRRTENATAFLRKLIIWEREQMPRSWERYVDKHG
jgi:hypothetical protein